MRLWLSVQSLHCGHTRNHRNTSWCQGTEAHAPSDLRRPDGYLARTRSERSRSDRLNRFTECAVRLPETVADPRHFMAATALKSFQFAGLSWYFTPFLLKGFPIVGDITYRPDSR
jgi:hypothetical protein